MQLDAADIRPRSLLDRRTPSPAEIVVGAAIAVFVHLGVPAIIVGVVALFAAIGVTLGRTEPEEPPPLENVIQARFLQLGEQIDPRELPNRRVPILRTDTPEPAPSKNAPMERPEPRAERQPDSVADALQRLSEDAQIFAEREERRIQEGDPDGIEGGEREASEGDRYLGILFRFFRSGWSVPTTIDRDRLVDLVTVANVDVDANLRVTGFRIVRSSGDADFDLSVTAQLQRLVDSQAVIPPPPEELAPNILGHSVRTNFGGRDAR